MNLTLPILVPLLAAATGLVGWRNPLVQRASGVFGALGLLAAGVALLADVRRDGIQVVNIGGWPAPYGITLVADHFSALMVVAAGTIGAAVAIYALVDIDPRRQAFGFFPLMNFLLMGVTAAFLAGDVFNLYVWFEVLLISAFVLLTLGNRRAQLEGAIKYVTLNLVASFLFLIAVGILYGAVGTLNMADAARKLQELHDPDLVTTLAMLFLITFGIKAAVFPLFFWLPASYHTPPIAVTALFSGLLTKVGVYALIRVFTLLFVVDVDFTHALILVLAALTMITGVLGAVAQYEIRRLLSFHIISQIGYMLMGLGLFTPLGLAGSIIFIVHNMVVKTNLFLIAGVARRRCGDYRLDRMGGLYGDAPALALLFGISALSLAGLPPLSGFLGKLALVRAGLDVGEYAVVAAAIGVSLLTLYSMTKIWIAAFWKPRPTPSESSLTGEDSADEAAIDTRWPMAGRLARWALMFPIVALAALAVLIGVGGGWVFEIAETAAHELLDSERYIQAVLGETP